MSNGISAGNPQLALLSNSQAADLNAIGFILGVFSALDGEPYTKWGLEAVSVVANLISLFSPDPVESEIGLLAQRIHDAYVELGAVDAAGQIQARKTILDLLVTAASTALEDLPKAIADPAHYSPSTLIVPCQTVVNNFAVKDNQIWNITYLVGDFAKIYWNDSGQYQSTCQYLLTSGGFDVESQDAGYGPQTPPLNADGKMVFEYRVTLPLYLWAITVFFVVGRALDPEFFTSMKADLVQARDTLKWVYDKILTPGSGLTPLCPPDWKDSPLQEAACPEPVDGALPPPSQHLRLIYSGQLTRKRAFPPVGVQIEYGAVEKYSGNSSIGDSYQINIQTPGDTQNPATIFNKLQVRTLKRMKDVYVNCGLLTVWQAINQLNALFGDPPLSSSTFQWQDGSAIDLVRWSCRQIFNLAKVAPSASGYSLRALGTFLIETQPFDTRYSAGATSFSLISLLTNFND